MTKHITWLASYPKSGNTWIRAFLTALQKNDSDPLDINKLGATAISSDRRTMEHVLGFDTGCLSRDHCARLRPIVYRWLNAQFKNTVFVKAHDACIKLDNGDCLMAPDVTDKAVYIIRNPLDIVISNAQFSGKTRDAIIARMSNPDQYLARQTNQRQLVQVPQKLGTWSDHVLSWTQNPHFTTHVARYEDLLRTPLKSFSEICTFLALPYDQSQIEQAIEDTSFATLQSQEDAKGFRERPHTSTRFFRNGKIGEWQEALSPSQINTVLADHLYVMQKFGYADRSARPCLSDTIPT